MAGAMIPAETLQRKSLFSLLHKNTFSLLPIFVLGLFFAYHYERTRNIAVPIGLHAIHNAITFFILLTLKAYQ